MMASPRRNPARACSARVLSNTRSRHGQFRGRIAVPEGQDRAGLRWHLAEHQQPVTQHRRLAGPRVAGVVQVARPGSGGRLGPGRRRTTAAWRPRVRGSGGEFRAGSPYRASQSWSKSARWPSGWNSTCPVPREAVIAATENVRRDTGDAQQPRAAHRAEAERAPAVEAQPDGREARHHRAVARLRSAGCLRPVPRPAGHRSLQAVGGFRAGRAHAGRQAGHRRSVHDRHCRDSLQSDLPERPCQREALSIRGPARPAITAVHPARRSLRHARTLPAASR